VPLSVRITKRAIDVIGAVVLILLFSPFLLLIALCMRLEARGPILYKQRRCGPLIEARRGNVICTEFDLYKFRTMSIDAEQRSGPVLAQEHDPRVTRVGRVLRKFRLDELPQLVNVLNGTMSLVGPRPERPELLARLAQAIPMFEERMRGIKPGLTGLSQVSLGYSGRPLAGHPIVEHLPSLTNPYRLDDTDGAIADEMRMKLLFDLAYAAACEQLPSYLRTELTVIAKTPWTMIRGVGR
jgi:lipopolysaccharide/colanic/teichoic acid biosynthesis glycosyltransferase